MRVKTTMRRTAVVAALVTGLAPGAMAAAQADSSWPTINGDAQHTRQGTTVGPWTPAVKWKWDDPTYVADGSIGGTGTNIPGILDESGRLLFKSRNTNFDERPGVSARYDLLALDPETGQESVLLPDVQDGYCVPAVGKDGTVWAMQDINERTEPATATNPAHGEHGHVDLTHHRHAHSWLVGVNPVTGVVEHRYSGEGVHAANKKDAVNNCNNAINIAPDGTIVFVDEADFNQWLRAINPDGTSKWEVNIEEEYADPRNWSARSGSAWQVIAPDGTAGAGTLYLGFTHREPVTDKRTAGLAAFDLDTGALRDTIMLPGPGFSTGAVVDPEGGIIVSIDGPAGSRNGSGSLMRIADDGNVLGVDWRKNVTVGASGPGELESIPDSLNIANQRVVGMADKLFSLDWADGELHWTREVGFIETERLFLDAAGNAYVAKLSSNGESKMNVFSPSGKWIGMTSDDRIGGLRTLGPLAADGTLYGWGTGNVWWALEHDPGGLVPCPEGTSNSVRCTLNPAGGYEMRGTAADETFVGSNRPDVMVGRGGDDVMRGKGQEDLLYGGRGNDILKGGATADDLIGGPGSDKLVGGSGRDRLEGGSGSDRLFGGSAADRMSGGSGPDLLKGQGGKDLLRGNKGNDRLVGGSGRDTFRGHGGRDVINAKGQRHEKVNCGGGRDKVRNAKGDRVAGNCEQVRR